MHGLNAAAGIETETSTPFLGPHATSPAARYSTKTFRVISHKGKEM
jgi:hypothetical protein